MQSLSILFTNNTLAQRAGSELWVRDVCRALVGRGHRPVAFSLILGAVAEEIRSATVPVVSSLDDVGFTPDVIHGHHHIETLIAALHFPGVPIVHFCHGFLPWEEAPLHHPSIARYVAVDAACVDRLTAEEGIAPEHVDQLLNFVDLKRFAPRSSLPPRPRRALVLSNQADAGGYVEIIREACRQSGVDLEIAGSRSGRVIERPEDLLPGIDLVFAKGRTALEAMAVGCAVVVADIFGCGPLVTLSEFDAMRSRNFGIRLLRESHSVDWYRSQIAAYDATDAALVAARVRREAGLDEAVDHLLDIYQRAIVERKSCESKRVDSLSRERAAGRHISSIASRFKHAHELERDRQSLGAGLGTARTANARLIEERQVLRAATESLASDLTTALDRNDSLVKECNGLRLLLTDYQNLSVIRLRDTIIGLPFLGQLTQRTVRWLNRSPLVR
jgi:glycosyltransferase involved in cell wall biosynthesis